MAGLEFLFVGSEQTWTVPAGVTGIDLFVVGGGSSFDYWPDYPNHNWSTDPYILSVHPYGWRLPLLGVTPGDVLGISVGGAGYLTEGGWPDGGSTASMAGYPFQARGHGGGGATRITRNGDLWIVAGGAGGAHLATPGEQLGPVAIAPDGPTTILPDGDPGYGTTTLFVPGSASGSGAGADSPIFLAGYVVDLVWPPETELPGPMLSITGSGAGGGGYNGGASGWARYYEDPSTPEDWPDELLAAAQGKAGGSLLPVEGTLWGPDAQLLYGTPGQEGYDEELGGIPELGYIDGSPSLTIAPDAPPGAHGYVYIGGLPEGRGWNVGSHRM